MEIGKLVKVKIKEVEFYIAPEEGQDPELSCRLEAAEAELPGEVFTFVVPSTLDGMKNYAKKYFNKEIETEEEFIEAALNDYLIYEYGFPEHLDWEIVEYYGNAIVMVDIS